MDKYLQVLGTGDRKVLTLTHRAQVKRFTADLIRLLKNTPGRMLYLSSLTEEFCMLSVTLFFKVTTESIITENT
jgi:hypothetical protein